MLKVICELKNYNIPQKKYTNHFIKDNKERRTAYFKDFKIGNSLNYFLVDKKHKNGLEIHIITTGGFIKIYNYNTKKFITILSGRPQQIKRYYEALSLSLPHTAINIANNRNKTYNTNLL